jgi:uncharacterized membrane protein
MQYVVAYLGAATAFLLIDLIWLGKVAKTLYRSRLAPLLRERFPFGAAAIFYLIYVIGVVVFALAPALESGSWLVAAWRGALFGFFAYGTYDMTNYITLKHWPLSVTAMDIAWGTLLTGTASVCGYLTAHAYLAA